MERTNVRIEKRGVFGYAAEMNSQKAGVGDKDQTRNSQVRISPNVWLCLALLSALCVLSGCAHLQQYSIDSWDGPLPLSDLTYIQTGQ